MPQLPPMGEWVHGGNYNNTHGQVPGYTNYIQGLQTPPISVPPTNQQTGQPLAGILLPTMDPSWLQLILGAVMATVANLQHGNSNLLGSPNSGTLTTTTRSAKLLNGTNKHSLLGFCSRSIQENPPEIFIILDSNEDPTTKFHALEDRLTAVQQNKPFVNLMLRQAMYTDIQKHNFHFVPHEKKHMMWGFTSFCLQKMDQTNKIMLHLLEEKMRTTTYTTMNDLFT